MSLSEPVSLRIQSILYGNSIEHVDRALESLRRAVDLAVGGRVLSDVELAYGDCSPNAIFTKEDIASRVGESLAEGIRGISYEFFGENLGSAGGHNRLLADLGGQEFTLILNPDTIVAPNIFLELFRPMDRSDVAIVEGRQIPIEHPKAYDPLTGETSWATTACALVRSRVVREVNGFDSETFFLYCDDVDFSWRVRLLGYKVVSQPSAVIFHDKRLSPSGKWMYGSAEEYYSAAAAMLLAYKYSRPDLAERFATDLFENGSEQKKQAVLDFRTRKAEGRLPSPIDPDHRVAQFVDGFYEKHRF